MYVDAHRWLYNVEISIFLGIREVYLAPEVVGVAQKILKKKYIYLLMFFLYFSQNL